MTTPLRERVTDRLATRPRSEVAAYAAMLAEEAGAAAVLFYGSNLRTGSLDGVLDFYVLLPGAQRERIWPRVGYREWEHGGEVLRAKIAAMSLEQFAAAARGASRDTTIWTRFVQPSALVWVRDEGVRLRVVEAVTQAAVTAARLAAALGPPSGPPEDYWRALFQATYRAEFRVERPGREDSILAANAEHFRGLLVAAWEAGGLSWAGADGRVSPRMSPAEQRRVLSWWRKRQRLGKALNVLRLAKATTTFDGAAAYAAWKLERHTGIALEVTPFREKHPLLAIPGAMIALWRARRRGAHM